MARRRRPAKRVPAFFDTPEWKRLRYAILRQRGARCECCGATPADGAVMNVDHMKSRLKHPELAMEPTNLQVLCARCNEGKGGRDDDWRAESDPANDEAGVSFGRWHFGGS